jgi:hypothetical protein
MLQGAIVGEEKGERHDDSCETCQCQREPLVP